MPRKTKFTEIHPERFKAAQTAYNEAQAAKQSGDLSRMAGALNKLGEILNEPRTNGRPLTEISQPTFEELCRIQCTLSEVASVLRCSPDTIERWCGRTYKATFAETYKKFAEEGKSSLRRLQFKHAQTNPAMAIFLGKNYLGQSDKMAIDVSELDRQFEAEVANLIAGRETDIPGPAESETVN